MDPLPLAFQCTRLPLVVILQIVQVVYLLIELGGEARGEEVEGLDVIQIVPGMSH